MLYGEYLLIRQKGAKAGTEYTFGRYGDGTVGPLRVHVRVGPVETIEIGGIPRKLVRITQEQKDSSGRMPDMTQVVHLDESFNVWKSTTKFGDQPETVWTACTEEVAKKAIAKP